MHWQTTRHLIDLTTPRVMGVVNLTPDSFSDGGHHASVSAGIRHCERLVAQGADILDLGAESTRPGSPPVPLDEERARLLPVLHEAMTLGVPVSVDTYKADVMREALDLGADIINDIWALRQPGAVDAVAAHARCGVCLMHMHGEPQTVQIAPMEGEAVPQVRAFLRAVWRVSASPGTRVWALARRRRKTSTCSRASQRCWPTAGRCWWVGRANPHWGR